ncbi:6171_t:CDS:2, partial [Racocetra fulgida]
MIDKFYPVIDRIKKLLCPDGLFGIADFYVSSRVISDDVQVQQGTLNRHCNWFTRWFWQIWFEFDHINLHPCRRDYVEYQFDTIKSFNGRNHFLIPYLVQIPYYVWLGTSKSSNSASHVNLNPIETISLASSEKSSKTSAGSISNKSFVNSPVWRQPYNPILPRHTQFNTYIYAFTWEDPREDLKVLNLSEEDSMLVITSAGDNLLEYALKANPKRIHCVDLNPCQSGALDSIRIHTNYIVDALKGLNEGELTRAVLMDHIDWFSESEAEEEIKQIARAVRKGGQVFWRSSARHPWYNKVFVKHGFAVEPICIREPGSASTVRLGFNCFYSPIVLDSTGAT